MNPVLSPFEWCVVLALILGDALVLRAYLRPDETRAKKRYPKRSFMIHALGGLAALVLGALAVLAHGFGLQTMASVCGLGQGVAVALFAGLFALPMARHTSGFPGFNLVGYVLYTLAWIVSALLLLWKPSAHTAYACFVLTHAYLTCRIMVWLIERGWERLRGQPLGAELAYSIATAIAALIPLALAWGWIGATWHLGFVVLAIALQRARISTRWHFNQKMST